MSGCKTDEVGKFKPEYIFKLDFYFEALDRQVKKENENPSVGLLLCASKNDEVVEYAMSRTMSPMLVSQYQLQLPDKALQKLMGHTNFKTSIDVYTHTTDDVLYDEMKKFEHQGRISFL